MHILRGFPIERPQKNLIALNPVWVTLINVTQARIPQPLVLSGKIIKLCKLSFEGYAGGARIENVRVKVYGVIKSLSMETVEIMQLFEKICSVSWIRQILLLVTILQIKQSS